jgi:hypothetical protein
MKNTLTIVLFSAAILASGCATSHYHSTAWDYKVVEGNSASVIEESLRKLGNQGWVVVSSSSAYDPNCAAPTVTVILKRNK